MHVSGRVRSSVFKINRLNCVSRTSSHSRRVHHTVAGIKNNNKNLHCNVVSVSTFSIFGPAISSLTFLCPAISCFGFLCPANSCPAILCPAILFPVIWSVNFMSCNFMSCNIDGPLFSCPSFSVNLTLAP